MINKEHLKKFLITKSKVKVITRNTDEMLQCFEVMQELNLITKDTLNSYRGSKKSYLRTEIYLDIRKGYATWEKRSDDYVVYKKEQRVVI